MRLTRVIVQRKDRGHSVKADFRGSSGQRVRLSLGQADTKVELREKISQAIVAEGDLVELRRIGGV